MNARYFGVMFMNEYCIRLLLISCIIQGQPFFHNDLSVKMLWCTQYIILNIQHIRMQKYLYSKRNEIIFVQWFVTSHVKSHKIYVTMWGSVTVWMFLFIVTLSGCARCKHKFMLTHCGGWRRFAFLTRWNSVRLHVLLSATPQGGMFPEVSHPQAVLGSLVSISWKFQFTKIVSEFVINF